MGKIKNPEDIKKKNLKIRLTEEEKENVKRIARDRKTTVSDLIRDIFNLTFEDELPKKLSKK